MAQMIAAGPGVAPAKHMAEHTASLALCHAQDRRASRRLCEVIGADNNAKMLAQYNNRKKAEVEKGNTYWRCAEPLDVDIHNCSSAFADDSVTHMLCGFIVFLIPDPAKAIASMKLSGVTLSMYPAKARPDLAGPPGPANGCSVPEDVTNHLKKAGFRDIEVVEVQSYMEFDDYETVCRFLLTKLPATSRVIAKMTNEEVLQTQDEMIADLKTWHPELPARMTGKVNIAYCRK
ncbi:S-adenosyl-L-methionine-dependent methyltransferase [Xylaria palmicola]|nr:S-adenosyl-L-methionine-dependent methyltransferase [Xylaria palmicola]